MKHYLFLLFLYLLYPICILGQDIHFSQFHETPLMINPAMTGIFNGNIRGILNYRDQWGSVAAPYRTYAFSYDMALLKKKWDDKFLGAGITVFNDKAGEFKMGITQVNLSLSSVITLNRSNIVSAGLQGGFAQKSVNGSRMEWASQFDGKAYNSSIPSGEMIEYSSFYYGDFAAGVSWNFWSAKSTMSSNDQFRANAGAAVFHINRPKQRFYSSGLEKLYLKIVIHGGTNIGIKNTNIALKPSVLYMKQGTQSEINAGIMVRYQLREQSKYTRFIKEKALSIGGYYRAGDAFISVIMFEIANYAVGISYDINTSGLTKVSKGRGGLEISLRYINPNPFQYGKGTQGTPML